MSLAVPPAASQKILIGSRDGTVRVWGSTLQVFAGHTNWVKAASATPDCKKIASASLDGFLRIWDGPSGSSEGTVSAYHSAEVSAILVSADGNIVVTAARDETIRVWDPSGKAIAKLTVEAPVTCCDLSSDGRLVLFGCYNKTLYLWTRTRLDEPPVAVGTHERALSSCSFNRRATLALSGCGRSTDFDGISAKVWTLATGETVTLTGHIRGIPACCFTPDASRAVTGSHDRTIKIWNAVSGAMLQSVETQAPVISLVFSLDGQRLLSGHRDGRLVVWTGSTFKEIASALAHEGGVRHAVFALDAKRIISCGQDGTLRWWKLNLNRVMHRHSFYVFTALTGLGIDRTFSKVVLGDTDGKLYFLRTVRL